MVNILAIQCKCYGPNSMMRFNYIANFFTIAAQPLTDSTGIKHFEKRFLISTAVKFSANAMNIIKIQDDSFFIINSRISDNFGVNWDQPI
ncbi:MAG: hypothetical protein LBF68_06790 [Christensenellaceae bacterium]|jgi:hypothetical protein|nr:hypothetical protein [Christensenellaceae bacterium]